MAKVILVDNLNRESVADISLEDNMDTQSAELKAKEYNDTHCHSDYGWFARAVEDDYQLWRGIEELI